VSHSAASSPHFSFSRVLQQLLDHVHGNNSGNKHWASRCPRFPEVFGFNVQVEHLTVALLPSFIGYEFQGGKKNFASRKDPITVRCKQVEIASRKDQARVADDQSIRSIDAILTEKYEGLHP